MDVVMFGASGMVGTGALLECLDDPGVREVVAVVRRPLELSHSRLRQLVVEDLTRLGDHASELGTPDLCLYCLGVSSAGMEEAAYRRVTLDLTVAVADVTESLNPEVVFCFVSGQGTGSSRAMWARVKREAEVNVLGRSFRAYAFRPGFIQPVRGVRSRTLSYRIIYTLLRPISPILRRLAPGGVTDTQTVGRAMLRVAREGYDEEILETADINRVGGQSQAIGDAPGTASGGRRRT